MHINIRVIISGMPVILFGVFCYDRRFYTANRNKPNIKLFVKSISRVICPIGLVRICQLFKNLFSLRLTNGFKAPLGNSPLTYCIN